MIFLELVLLFSLEKSFAAPVFGLDPLCDTSVSFKTEVDHARPNHSRFPQFKAILASQNGWFMSVQKHMVGTCLADKKFAEEIVKRDRSALTGQCKPAAEAALADQEILEFAENRLKDLKQKKRDFIDQGTKEQEGLAKIFERDHALVDSSVLDLGEAPRETACELRWLYPRELLKKKIPFKGCAEAAPGTKLPDEDKEDPGAFARMMSRYERSITYNTQRRNNAEATAKASRARYDECVAKFPGTENMFVSATKGSGGRASVPVPAGKGKSRESKITGIEEDEAKRLKK